MDEQAGTAAWVARGGTVSPRAGRTDLRKNPQEPCARWCQASPATDVLSLRRTLTTFQELSCAGSERGPRSAE